MAEYLVSVAQSGADTANAIGIATGLTVDGKAGWSIKGFTAYWQNAESAAAADWEVDAALLTELTGISFVSQDTMGMVAWGCQNTAGVAVAIPVEPIKRVVFPEPRVSVQPSLYARVESNNTGQANTVIFRIEYEIIKLTDIEVLRLFAAGG